MVRQTVSKWERGLSVPDLEMLLSISEILEVPVRTLLAEKMEAPEAEDMKAISEKIEIINLQLAQKREADRKVLHGALILAGIGLISVFAFLWKMKGAYLLWDYNDPETAVLGRWIHGFEWIFVRLFPIVLVAILIGIVLTRKKNNGTKMPLKYRRHDESIYKRTPPRPSFFPPRHGILNFMRDGDDLVLEMDPGFVDLKNDEVVAGCLRIEGVGFTDSYVHVLHYRDVLCRNVGRFSGKKHTLTDFVANFSKEWGRMDIMGEFDGYRTVVFTGFLMQRERIAEVLMEIDYSGDFLYEIKEG